MAHRRLLVATEVELEAQAVVRALEVLGLDDVGVIHRDPVQAEAEAAGEPAGVEAETDRAVEVIAHVEGVLAADAEERTVVVLEQVDVGRDGQAFGRIDGAADLEEGRDVVRALVLAHLGPEILGLHGQIEVLTGVELRADVDAEARGVVFHHARGGADVLDDVLARAADREAIEGLAERKRQGVLAEVEDLGRLAGGRPALDLTGSGVRPTESDAPVAGLP
jgi:hypothetical protein